MGVTDPKSCEIYCPLPSLIHRRRKSVTTEFRRSLTNKNGRVAERGALRRAGAGDHCQRAQCPALWHARRHRRCTGVAFRRLASGARRRFACAPGGRGRWQWAQSAQGQDKYAAHHARARGVLGDQEDQGQGQIAHAHAIGGRGGSATPPIALPSRAR